jgi:hypothetical protein
MFSSVHGYQPILILKKKSALFSSINSIVADVCLSVTSWTILTIEAKALIELESLNSKFELELATSCSLYWHNDLSKNYIGIMLIEKECSSLQ